MMSYTDSKLVAHWQALLKGLLRVILRLAFGVKVNGLEHFTRSNQRLLIVANHHARLDPVLLYAFLPGKLMFVVNTLASQYRSVQFLIWLGQVKTFVVDVTNPFALRSLIHDLERHPEFHAVVFPEGRISVTGSLMKIYEGPGLVADKIGAALLPVAITGAQFFKLSSLMVDIKTRWFPRIGITLLPPVKPEISPDITGRARRKRMSLHLHDLMVNTMYQAVYSHVTLPGAFNRAASDFGESTPIVWDTMDQKHFSYRQIKRMSRILGSVFRRQTSPDSHVGLLLPTASVTVAAIFGLLSEKRVPVLLNFTAGVKNLKLAVKTARITTVYTSRRFVAEARLGDTVQALSQEVSVVYLEDIRERLGLTAKLLGFVRSFRKLPQPGNPDDSAVVLFTSGTTGTPKGVVLSHANIMANMAQVLAMADIHAGNRILNAMPAFHAFGLVAGMIIPVLGGVRTFLYPNPLHLRNVPEMAYRSVATTMLGTDTFLSRYARYADPYDFFSMRFAYAGAEKVRMETYQIWAEKLGVLVLEGYGITETGPILSLNTLSHHKWGSAGRFLPGIRYFLEPFEGVENGGRLYVKGPNIMRGYLLADDPGRIQPPFSDRLGAGWFDTGDIVTLDDEGYITIVGRAKRFAKVGGEIVPLEAVEQLVHEFAPESGHSVVSVSDPLKGERLVLLTESPQVEKPKLAAHIRERGLPGLWIPEQVKQVEKLPRLATGKVDLSAAESMAREGV